MCTVKKHLLKVIATLLCAALVIGCFPSFFIEHAYASAADNYETNLLPTLSSSFEGTVGTISTGTGDLGGKSYGLFQLASRYDSPKSFFNWCITQSDAKFQYIGNQLSAAYAADGNTYGTNFDAKWTELANDDTYGGGSGPFAAAQVQYAKGNYYTPLVNAVESAVSGFSISNYSIALRSVFWSRAIQHGSAGAANVITRAFAALGGFANQPEADLIAAIYAESGAIAEPDGNTLSGNGAMKYGISGASMKYYSGSSSDVQEGVYLRLNVNEPSIAFQRLADYGTADTVLEPGSYTLSGCGQTYRFVYFASGYYTLTAANGQRLTDAGGSAALSAATANTNQFWALQGSGSTFALRNRATGSYLALSGSSLVLSSSAQNFTFTVAGSDWALSGGFYPTEDNYLVAGSGFWLRGILHSYYPIRTVNISLINSAGDTVLSKTASGINATDYNLRTYLDGVVTFGSLAAGTYTFHLTATNSASSTYTKESTFYVVPAGGSGKTVVALNAEGGSCASAYKTVATGSGYGSLPSAFKSGYTFAGWYTSPIGGTQVSASTTASGSNQIVYAHYSAGSQPVQTGVAGFVTRLYNICLYRDPDSGGLSNWVKSLDAHALTGAQVAASFFGSAEYTGSDHTNAEFVTALYRAILGREPDSSGLAHWINEIQSGSSWETVFDGFCGSREFNSICASYGVTAGRIDPSDYDMGQTTAFVRRLYRVCLNREPDAGGLANWVNNLKSHHLTGAEVSASFFSSAEYVNSDHTSAEFVTALYRAMLGREPDSSGLAHWVNNIQSGSSWETVFDDFCGSQEFNALCISYGVTAGRVDLSNYDMGQTVAFVRRLYRGCLNREPDAGGLANWVGQLKARSITGADTAGYFFTSPEFTSLGYDNTSFVTALYRTLLGREPDSSGLSSWTADLNSGVSRISVVGGFCNSPEFKNLCSSYGITPGQIG